MTQRKKEIIISALIHSFVALVLLVLLVFLTQKNSAGEYYELLINKALSKTLNPNWFKTVFATFFAVVAEYPAYIILPIFAPMLFYSSDLIQQKYRAVFKAFMLVLTFGGWCILCYKSEVVDYIKHAGFDGLWFYITMGIGAIIGWCLSIFFAKYIPKKTRYLLFKFAIFAIVYLLIALVVNQGLKMIWHRMRFRDMLKENALGHDGYSYYTPWYIIDCIRIELNPEYEYTSFPSGHSNSATHIFLLCVLYECLPKWKEKKWLKYVIYTSCILFVLLATLSRICDDAHFMSDTIAGAGISYIIFKVLKFLFFRKGTNFAVADKALAELE